MTKHLHTVPALQTKQRLSDYAIGIFPSLETKSALKKALKKCEIKVNGQNGSSGTWISGGEVIAFHPTPHEHPVWKRKIRVLFEDDDLAVVEKPAGFPTSGNRFKTLRNTLSFNLYPSVSSSALIHPEPIHRLDSATSGLVIIAKSWHAMRNLNSKMQYRGIRKTYLAIVHGKVERPVFVHQPIDEKPAYTYWESMTEITTPAYGTLSLISIVPHTGRTHQIRRHLALYGIPVLGDHQYNTKNSRQARGLFLHALSLQFYHPIAKTVIHMQSALHRRFRKRLRGHIPNHLK